MMMHPTLAATLVADRQHELHVTPAACASPVAHALRSSDVRTRNGWCMSELRMLIDGKLVDAEGGRTFANINPATEEVLGQVADGSAADMEAAIVAARRAFDTTSWSTDHALRKRCLLQLQAALEAEREELRAELVAEVGCPVLITYGPQLDAPLREALTWPAEQIDSFPWSRSLGAKDAFGMGRETEREVWKEPIGVIGVIVPWNFPVEIILNKLGPVLAMGNTCVLKPAPDTPWNATRIGRLIAEHTDIPPGVVNIVTASDHLVGEVLTTSPLVDMIAFTGSTATGKRIMQAASANLKPVFLELGGKSINLLLDDADFSTVGALSSSVCFHGGQGCAMPTRMLIPRSHYDDAVEAAAEAFAASPTAIPPMRPTSWARSSPRSSGNGCSATSRRARRRAPASSSAAAGPSTCPPVGTWSPRCSPTSTTR